MPAKCRRGFVCLMRQTLVRFIRLSCFGKPLRRPKRGWLRDSGGEPTSRKAWNCHRFSAEAKYLLAVEAKEKANTPVVLVCGATQDSEIPATSRVYALGRNSGLIAALSGLFPAQAARPQAVA